MPLWFRWQQDFLRFLRIFLLGPSKKEPLSEKFYLGQALGEWHSCGKHERNTQAASQAASVTSGGTPKWRTVCALSGIVHNSSAEYFESPRISAVRFPG
jgi:hypothetical protein